MEPLLILFIVTAILALHLLADVVSKISRVPRLLLLIFAGLGLRYFLPVNLSDGVIAIAAAIGVMVVTFHGFGRLQFKVFDTYTNISFRLILVSLALNLLFLSTTAYFLLGMDSILAAVLFASLLTGIDFLYIKRHTRSKDKVAELLGNEGMLGAPISMLLFLMLFYLITASADSTFQVLPFIQGVTVGIGTGLFLGIIIFQAIRETHTHHVPLVVLIVSMLSCFLLAEWLGGYGYLAVAVLGLMLANLYLKHKETILEHSTNLAQYMDILALPLMVLVLPRFDVNLVVKSLIVFSVLVVIRLYSVLSSFVHENLRMKEKIRLALTDPKGIPVIVAVLLMRESRAFMSLAGAAMVLDLLVLLVVYSLILSTVTAKFSNSQQNHVSE
jgi:NhaP-type Na+/H+ or K+/H+ antiporter